MQGARFGAAIAAILRRLHSGRFVHRDVQPHAFLATSEGEVHPLAVERTSQIPRETRPTVHPEGLDGNLAYVSPEQTGRMNRAVDWRTDLYSLGATLHHLLVGHPPFSTRDPVQLVHAHIAQAPRPPRELQDRIPDALNDLVLRLLAKNAEDRYQSASGVEDDLRTCLRRLENYGEIGELELGTTDRSDQLRIPDKLYGRDRDLRTLIEAWTRVSDGGSELLLVAGYSGVGKSALVHELHKRIVEQRGYFVSGKQDQFRRGVPYHSLAEAFADLTRQLLTESADRVAAWRHRVEAALGENLPVVVDLVPALRHLVGDVPAPVQLPPAEAELRFNTALERFARVFAGDQPLILFLDDLQWADAATLKLVRHLLGAGDMNLLVVGAYRDNEVHPAHPLMLGVEAMREAGTSINDIRLRPLTGPSVEPLVVDTLGCTADRAAPLVRLLLAKTDGNPFFLRQFLASLFVEGLLSFSAETRRWDWELAAVEALGSTDNVVDLMVRKLRRFEEATRDALRLAACVGNTFDPAVLALVSERSEEDTRAAIWPAIEEGLVLRRGELLAFLHDRVQQAAYQLIDEADRPGMHLRIGRLLREWTPDEELDERSFDIVEHMGHALEQVTDPAERLDLARLNVAAGQRARDAMAYDASVRYLSDAVELLGEAGWTEHPELCFQAHFDSAEAVYLTGAFADADERFDRILASASSVVNKVRVHEVRTVLGRHGADYPGALVHAIAGLALTGIALPPPEETEQLVALMGEAGAALAPLMEGRSPAELIDLPEMTDPLRLVEADLLAELMILGYFFNPVYVQVAVLTLVARSLEYGTSSASPAAFGAYGMTIGTAAGQYEAGYEFGQMAMRLANKQQNTFALCQAQVWFGGFTSHWREPVDDGIAVLKECVETSLRIGAPLWAAYAAFFAPVHTWWRGAPLADSLEAFDRYIIPMEGQSTAAAVCYRSAARGLMGLHDGAGSIDDSDEGFVHREHEATMRKDGLFLALQHYFVARMVSHNHFGQHADALAAHAEATAEGSIHEILFAQLTPVELSFHHGIALSACLQDGSIDDAEAARAELDGIRERLVLFAENNPAIFEHMRLLLDAEAASLDGRELDAITLFDDAIDRARSNGFLGDEALSMERASRFHARSGRSRIGRQYLRNARSRYGAWGAQAKVAQIDGEIGETRTWRSAGNSGLIKAAPGGASSLDMASVLKAARIVSGEIEMDRLLKRSMEILVENAGAGRGVLLLSDGAGLVPSAVSRFDSTGTKTLVGADLVEASYPQAVVDYCRRTRDPVVLAEATQDALFGSDAWITKHKPRSVLSVPILNKGRLIGILYVENNLSAGAFTTDRVGVLQALCSQIAVSIENARLFRQQRMMTDAFARFVPKQFLEHLGKDSVVDIERGDAVGRDITVLFGDLRNFTSMSEMMSASENFQFLNAYMERMEPAIEAHKGFVDKYMGDAIMALFSRTADDAIASAVDMHRALQLYNSERAGDGRNHIDMGVGVHHGPAMLGTIGSAGRVDTTVIGDTVNLASRLEGLTKRYGANLLISDDTLRQTEAPEAFLTRHAGRVLVKGKQLAATVHEVLDADPERIRNAKLSTLDLYRSATDAYYERGFPDAAEQFRQCLQACPEDTMAAYWMGRSVEAGSRNLAEDWTGVEVLTSK